MENICYWNKCKKPGNYKAPVEKDNCKNYKWLCAQHIKEFNKSWNYFENMTEDQIKLFLKSDMTWHRPTQKFGSRDNFFDILWNNALNDKFEIFKNITNGKYISKKNLSSKDKEAFMILDLKTDAGWLNIQKRFKTLVKKFHPDMNSGSRKYEEKLKTITIAYSHLKKILKESENVKFK